MMQQKQTNIISDVDEYYTQRLKNYGPVPKGVDLNSEESQVIRFAQLIKIIRLKEDNDYFTINDIGCGYGAFFDYLRGIYKNYLYYGNDISIEMINEASRLHAGIENAKFRISDTPEVKTDYAVASGLFNVKLGYENDEWLNYIFSVLRVLDKNSKKGFAFNCLTKYSDFDKMKANLYYADPCFMFDYCKKNFSKNVALLHDYGLYDFTILVRKYL